ncbi:MAG: cytochrome C biogenesis protein, partial [Oscillospiraceae bacterium]|nr:cytochrome C biogenesis protein [Oscillospiraceae bacterium]
MGLSLDISLSAVTVFLQGLLSFFSPCVLPLLPIYVGYLSGGTVVYETDGSVRCDRKKVLINTLFFVIGISFAFVVLGLGMSLVGVFFRRYQRIFSLIGGVLVILFGLYQLGAFGTLRFLSTEKRFRLPMEKLAASPLTALLMGFCFSFSWTPCIGPTLSSVLLMAASSAS